MLGTPTPLQDWNGCLLYLWLQLLLTSFCFLQARREKISERMKILQDLVPGCNKVGIGDCKLLIRLF